MCNITMFEKLVGSREEVFKGIAQKTTYGKDALFKKDIVYSPNSGGLAYKSKYKVKHVPPQLKKWTKAVQEAKKDMGIKKGEMVLVKGKLAKKAHEFFSA
jgi:DVNP family